MFVGSIFEYMLIRRSIEVFDRALAISDKSSDDLSLSPMGSDSLKISRRIIKDYDRIF